MIRRLLISALPICLLLVSFACAQEAAIDDVSQQATRLEAELGKYKDTSAQAADTMAALVDLYYQHGRVFGLIRAAQKFVAAHPADERHKDIMLKLLDGLQVTSRNEDFVAACRQFLTRYPEASQCATLEVRLARTLHRMKDRIASADAYRAIWRRQPNTETGRRAGVTACELYSAAGGKNVSTGAELAEEMFERLGSDEFRGHVGWWAFGQWRRISQWAKSNVVGNKLLAEYVSGDNKDLWQLNRDIAENYWNQNQHANAVLSLRRCRSIRDDDQSVHYQLIEQMFGAGAKPNELEPVVREYIRKYPDRPDRYTRQSLLAHSHLKTGDKKKGLELLKEVLGFEASYHGNASAFVRENGKDPAQLAETERVLLSAISKNSKDTWYLRYVLGFELYRDRMKDEAKARRVLREFISQSPTDNSYSWNVVSWLLDHAPGEEDFRSDVALILEARRENIHMEQFRGYLGTWAQQAKRKAKRSDEHRDRANYVADELTRANSDPVVDLWLKFRGNRRNKPDAGLQEQLLASAIFNQLNDTPARTLLWDLAYYYRNQSSTKRKSESVPIYGRLVERFDDDYPVAVEYLRAATDYGSADDAAKAALHVMKFEPNEKTGSDTWRRLLVAADKAEDDELAGRAYIWIKRSQQASGRDPGYAAGMGDILARRGAEQKAVDYWTAYCSYDPTHTESRECAWRLLSRMTTPMEKISFLRQLLKPDTDYFGRYALWLAREYFALGDFDRLEKVMRDARKRYDERPFLGWDMSAQDLYGLVTDCRGNKEMSDEDKRRIFAVARDMELDWASATASLALLEMTPQDSTSPIERLADYQAATRIVADGSWVWDQLMAYAQARLAEDDHMAAATLVTGMLANVANVDAKRKTAGRELVAQSYSRMGAVGLTIDENSEIAPLLHAALYLRLGEDWQAFETYLANKKMFDKHRDEVPVDLLLFVCENHIAAGGDDNHDRAEEILRGWIVKHSESNRYDDNIKAKVQFLLAKNFSKARRYDLARSEYTTVINRYPDTAQALEAEFGVGETFMAQKVYDQAELVFEELANRREADVIVRAEFLRGVLAFRRGDRDEARDIFRTVLERVPDVDLANQALFHLAQVYGDQERYIDQLNLLRTVGRLGRRSKRWHAPGVALSIVIQDSDLGISRGHNKIPVSVTTQPGGDSELVYLVSGGAGKGLFRADLETQLGQARKNDKVLQLTGRDVVRCDYPEQFKQEFRRVPLSDVDIHIAADAAFDVAGSKIVDEEEEGFSRQLQREADEAEQDLRISQIRPADQIKPGNQIYMRVKDADRDLSDEIDQVVVKLTAESGDQVQVALSETGPHTGIFEGAAETGELPAGALATDAAIEHGPLMAIDRDRQTYWLSEPDGATPKTLTIDMKGLKRVTGLKVSTPAADRNAPVRGQFYASNDGRFWFRLAGNPPRPPAEPVAADYGPMTRRVYSGHYTRFTTWDQVVGLSRNVEPIDEARVSELSWTRPGEDENAKRPFAVLWHGKLVQERDGAARIAVRGALTAVAIDGRLELDIGPDDRTVDVWLERGTHDLTVFSVASTGSAQVGATLARASHDVADAVMMPFQASDSDLQQPFARPAARREPVRSEFGETEWVLRLPPHELRYVKFVIHEYLGEAVAINNVEVAGDGADQVYIPTDADVLSLATNNVLEIAGGDVITASYTDEFTQRESAGSRLLTANLTATYFDANVAPIAYDFVRAKNGAVTEVRKRLMRIDPGERLIAEIVDYDRDETKERDSVQFEVIVNDGDPVELTATETEEYSGTFTREIDTSAEADPNKLTVRQGDRIYLRYHDSQNTFPGHAVPREAVVYVNTPTEGRIRIMESRFIGAEAEGKRKPQFVYTAPNEGTDVSRVALEAPLTIEVIDPDAAKASNSRVTVTVTTTDGVSMDVTCVVSDAFMEETRRARSAAWELLALEEGRFVGQVVLQLGGKTSPDLAPITAGIPRGLIGGPKIDEESESELDSKLVTRVLNVAGKDRITTTYSDQFRPDANAVDLAARGRIIANGQLIVTDRDYDKQVTELHVGEKLFLMVADADQDSSDRRDTIGVEITSELGEKEVVPLAETLAHSGLFTGSFTLKATQTPEPGNLQIDEPAIECYFGDTLGLKYVDKAANTESGELELLSEVPVVIGTDGAVTAFSKKFDDEALAVETKFRIAESCFELFKSHKELEQTKEQASDLDAGRRVLHEILEDHPDPKHVPRTAYLLGQFAQELEHWDEAVESYEMIVRQYPEHPLASDAQYKLAQTHEESGDFDAALEAYVTLAATYPKSPLIANVMIRICDHFYKKENYEVAAQVGEKFLEKFEAHQYAPRIAFRQGQCHYKSEKYKEAAAAFDRFAKRFVDDDLGADALFWAGESYRMAKKNVDAFQRYNRCRWDFPASEAAKYARGRLAMPEMLRQFEQEAERIQTQ